MTLLERMERARREDFLAFQFARLKRQLERVYAGNEFYRAKWKAARVAPGDIRSMDDFSKRIPLVTKTDFLADQQERPPFGSRLGVPREQVVLVTTTGGTSGIGQEIYGRTAADMAVHSHLHYLPYHMAGLRRGDIVFNCAPAGGMTSGGWGPSDGFRQGGATAFHAGGVISTDAKIDMMCRIGAVNFIYASTNYLHTLTEAFRRRAIAPKERFPTMRALYIAAEGYPPAWALEIEAFWGCRLHEGYGSTQATGFAYTSCPSTPRKADARSMLHALEWLNLTEVLNPDTGEPVKPGEEGEIILTNLAIHGSPCIRFSTRDKARWFPHDACGCGRPWDLVEAGSIGRYDDMMKIRGNNVWPVTVDTAVFSHPEVAEYAGRVYVDDQGRTEVLVRLAFKAAFAAAPGAAKADCLRRIAESVKQRTNVAMTVVEVPRAELPTFDYKARRWKDERQSGYAKAAHA
ncbi:MAG: phenylacetate--CoA ligase family protein [Betaproteobacteria bacterium]|nr:MAG: phenylacetate--CoA ligase family protein [Betaproteobacteria bacterium]